VLLITIGSIDVTTVSAERSMNAEVVGAIRAAVDEAGAFSLPAGPSLVFLLLTTTSWPLVPFTADSTRYAWCGPVGTAALRPRLPTVICGIASSVSAMRCWTAASVLLPVRLKDPTWGTSALWRAHTCCRGEATAAGTSLQYSVPVCQGCQTIAAAAVELPLLHWLQM
jgi:hypothetical protein